MDVSSGLQFLSLHPFVRSTVADKFRGLIVGSALGDCIGLYTEFLSKQVSWDAYPLGKFQLVEPVTPFKNDGHRNKFTARSWTDDTDHALLIILSYLHNDGKLLPHDLATRLRIWVEQGLRCLHRLPLGLGRTVGRVVLDKTYLSTPTLTAHKYWVASNYAVAPNGSLMRTHPLGAICIGKSLKETFEIATTFSRVTHADTRCVVACCISTGLIRGILRGEVRSEKNIDTLIETAFAWVEAWQKRGRNFENDSQDDDEWVDACAPTKNGNGDEPEIALDEHTRFKEQEQPEPPLDIEELYKHTNAKTFTDLQLDDSMKMGYVYKSLGAAILSLRLAVRSSQSHFSQSPPYPFPSPIQTTSSNGNTENSSTKSSNLFEAIITDLTMNGGDADTNACIAGALLGAWLGYDALPWHWRDGLEHREWLTRKCDALAQVVGIEDTRLLDARDRYRGSEDPDTRIDGGKGLLSKEALEARERAFMEAYLRKGLEKMEEDRNKTRAKKGRWCLGY